ncbi:MAG TPA: aminotransferase class V-fold PLP-dependent enzyme [Gaiellaceae bacterium]|jgi:selenocysteine lyase/cysteine desulfurase|nr:aminotransferase class V-fold PLP-dependent enzyme [Gaiellaceae bacterium]
MPPPTDDAIESLRRDEFPLVRERVYLDFATFGPPPLRAVRAAAEQLDRDAHEGSLGLNGTALVEAVRGEAATLLHCETRSVCLPTSTSEGMNLVAAGLDWRAGDEVLVHEREFEGCAAPFLHLPDATVVRAAHPDEIPELVGERTRAVALSLVDRVTGARAPVEEIAAACREHGAWLALDAAQAMGVLDLDPEALGADVVSAHGYKFLLSGFGLAPTYCSDRVLAELRVPRRGWKNADACHESAARFEPTMFPLPVLAGMHESLRLLNSFDPAERERRAIAAARAIAQRLDVSEPQSSLISLPRENAESLVARLGKAGVVAAAVGDRVRLSTHFFTTDDDVEALLARI